MTRKYRPWTRLPLVSATDWHRPPALTPISIPRSRRIRAAHAVSGIRRNRPLALGTRRDGTAKVSWRILTVEFWAWAWWRLVLWFLVRRHETRIYRDQAERNIERMRAHRQRWTVSPDCEEVAPDLGFDPFALETE